MKKSIGFLLVLGMLGVETGVEASALNTTPKSKTPSTSSGSGANQASLNSALSGKGKLTPKDLQIVASGATDEPEIGEFFAQFPQALGPQIPNYWFSKLSKSPTLLGKVTSLLSGSTAARNKFFPDLPQGLRANSIQTLTNGYSLILP